MKMDDEEAVLDLWTDVWGMKDRERARQQFHCDPVYLEHTYVAVSPGGALLGTVHYWLHNVRDIEGRPRRVGSVSHVATHSEARRQGHALTLMQILLDVMRRDGCEWTMLYSSEMGKPLYPNLGYRPYSMPYMRGLLTGALPQGNGDYAITTYDPAVEDWATISRIYDAYNETRPLTLVRTQDYWSCRIGLRYYRLLGEHRSEIYVAKKEGKACGYLLAYYSTREMAQKEVGWDQLFTIGEIGALPGHEAAIPALLAAALAATDQGKVGGRMMLPREDPVLSIAQRAFGETFSLFDDHNIMARPLTDSITEADLEAWFADTRSIFWLADEF
jgi:GNAT superfamily N-acetyltransferase